jgi:3'(2'), 5'-bisphosphate nucleotidase
VSFDRKREVERVLEMARHAAAAVSRGYARGTVDVEFKGVADPVTVVDREANAILCDELSRAYPGFPIVAEESDPRTYAGFELAPRVWFVDPLDGTREFIARNDEFAVMVGLAEHGRATLGVVLCPALGREFIGGEGIGAFEIAKDGTRRPISVSQTSTLAEAELLVSRSHRLASLDEAAARLGVKRLVPCGSAGVKAVKVAAGEADIYAHPRDAGKLWDACAPEAIVRAAGGVVTDGLGSPIRYATRDLANAAGFVATNPFLHDATLGLVRLAAPPGS